MLFIHIITLLVTILIIYNLVVYIVGKNKIIECASSKNEADFQPYSQDNPLILAEKNAANIQFIKGQLDEIYNVKTMILDISNAVALNTYNVNQIGTVAAQQAHKLTGTTPSTDITTPSIKPSVKN
jgi:hypothetical protein